MSLLEVTNEIISVLSSSNLGFTEVTFGEENLMSKTPSLMVEPTIKSSALYATGRSTEDEYTLHLTILHAKMEDNRITRASTLELAEDTVLELHKDVTLNGKVVFGYVTAVEPGFLERSNGLFKATRLTWYAKSRGRI